MSGNDAVRAGDRRHVFHSWSAQGGLDAVPIAGGAGVTFWDHDGNRWLDFASQLVYLNLGHQHPEVVAAVVAQAERLCTVAPSFANETRNRAAEAILRHVPAGLTKVFFTNGGAEAIENAVRLARLHTGRHKVLSTYRSYHGATAGALSLSGDSRRWPSEPGVPGVVRFFGPYAYRSAFGARSDTEECDRALAHLAEVVQMEGPDHVAAIVLETIVGTNGVLVPPDGYLAGVRSLCDRHGIQLIADEVMVGFGRTGAWFALDHWGVTPDLLCFAKGVNSGYVPLGGVVLSSEIAATFDDRAFPGGLTYSGHPLACAAAVAAIEVMERDDVVAHAAWLGREVFAPGLAEIAARHPSVGEVRGLGCFWAVELVCDRVTRQMLVPYGATGAAAEPIAAVAAAMRSAGVWPFTHNNRVHLAPPLIIDEAAARRGLEVLDDALADADTWAMTSRNGSS